ncbi:MAG: enoyl-CoA hydratase/isomerase family protein [Betaproteobacteria bacterium]|jgi:methylglutaconyl-CoA hydratase|nr:enoyl-CoA hydratase/isomerase family protein [Betaproteobacteria bacterium]NDF64807.1 enoyl-CoA hydratase/isomerase family protein [Betaproteobacteria bacterium]
MSDHLLQGTDHGVHTITLNRPDIRNAFDDMLIGEIHEAFDAVSRRTDVRCVVLAANGPAFCAGGDLHWMRRMADYTREQNLADAGGLAAMLRAIDQCPHPTLARVQGDVFAGGLGLVSACDMAVCADSATFCLSEVRIGLIPATISPYVVRAIGARASRRYFLTAERFSAAEAHRIGLVHESVPMEQLDATVQALIKILLANSPMAVQDAKRLVDSVAGQDINEALIAQTVAGIADSRASADGKEGVQAFLDKRKPKWLL